MEACGAPATGPHPGLWPSGRTHTQLRARPIPSRTGALCLSRVHMTPSSPTSRRSPPSTAQGQARPQTVQATTLPPRLNLLSGGLGHRALHSNGHPCSLETPLGR